MRLLSGYRLLDVELAALLASQVRAVVIRGGKACDLCFEQWSTRDSSESTKRLGVDDVLIAINTSLLGARGLEHQDGVPGKSGVLKSVE